MQRNVDLDSIVAIDNINEVKRFLQSYTVYEDDYNQRKLAKILSEIDKYRTLYESTELEYSKIVDKIIEEQGKFLKNPSKLKELKEKQEEFTEKIVNIHSEIDYLDNHRKSEIQESIRENMANNQLHIDRLNSVMFSIEELINTPPPPPDESTKCCPCLRRGGKTKRVHRLQSKSRNKSRKNKKKSLRN